MKYEQAVTAIRSFFAIQWDITTKVSWPDVSFTPPNATWIRFIIGHADGYQASMGSPGNNRHRRTGLVTIQVFQLQGQGGNDASKKADLAVACFLGKSTQGISFYDVQAKEIGNDGNGWYQWNVLAYFKYDTIA